MLNRRNYMEPATTILDLIRAKEYLMEKAVADEVAHIQNKLVIVAIHMKFDERLEVVVDDSTLPIKVQIYVNQHNELTFPNFTYFTAYQNSPKATVAFKRALNKMLINEDFGLEVDFCEKKSIYYID